MRAAISLALLVACAKSEDPSATTLTTDTSDADTDTDTDADTDADADSDSETTPTADTGTTATPPSCDAVNPGTDWAWNGACPQMLTACEIEVTDCELTIAYSSGMSMGMPTGAVVSASEVTFNAAGSVDGCVGTVIDADSIEGTCAGGCAFTLSR